MQPQGVTRVASHSPQVMVVTQAGGGGETGYAQGLPRKQLYNPYAPQQAPLGQQAAAEVNLSITLPLQGPLGIKPVQHGAFTFIAMVSGQGEANGLRADDKILAVNGAPMLGLGMKQVIEHLSNPARPLQLFVSRVSSPPSSGQGGGISV
jgi:hypothetical protein